MKVKFIIKKYFNELDLFKNKDFCKLVCKETFYDYNLLNDISVEVAIPIVDYVLEMHDKYIVKIFHSIESIQLEVIKRIEIPYDELLYVIDIGTKETAQYLLDNDYRIESLLEISFDNLFELAARGIVFPKRLLYEDKFISWITSIKNVKKYRIFVNLLSKNHDTSFIEDIRKKYYEEQILNYDENMDMLAVYSECYQKLLSRSFDVYELDKLLEECLGDIYCNEHLKDLSSHILGIVLYYSYRELKELFHEESHLQLTNMIIDYHFEDIAHNVFLDVRELLNFNSKVKVISEEDVLRYGKILNLDNVSYQEAKKLYEELKNYHYSQFYDHIRIAKDKAIDLMEQVILNEETIQKYRDKDLSDQHGVDVYVLDGDEYYALIKSLDTYKDVTLEKDIIYHSDGSSYTLDSSMKRDTYFSPRRIYNLIYSTIPKNQIVHMFSVDSFSKYNRDLNETATSRVYEIRTPEELVRASSHYNEIVIAVPNSSKANELNANLQAPKVMGIYCFDRITNVDVISAKNLKIGIVLVKTDKYNQEFETLDKEMSEIYRDLACGGGEDSDRFDYVRDMNSDDMAYRKRLPFNKN